MAEEGDLSEMHACRRLSLHPPTPQGSRMTNTQRGIGITQRRTMPAAGTVTWQLACPASWQKAWQVTSRDVLFGAVHASFCPVCKIHRSQCIGTVT